MSRADNSIADNDVTTDYAYEEVKYSGWFSSSGIRTDID